MADNSSSTNITKQIHNFISRNKTGEAINLLLTLSNGSVHLEESILIISGNYQRLISEKIKRTISEDEYSQRLNRINDDILLSIDCFDSSGIPIRQKKPENKNYKLLKTLAITLFAIGSILGVISYFSYGSTTETVTVVIAMGAYYLFAGSLILGGAWLLVTFIKAVTSS